MTHRFGSLLGSHGKDLVAAAALIWAVLIVAVTGTLDGTQYADQLLPVLGIAAVGCVVIVAAGVRLIHG